MLCLGFIYFNFALAIFFFFWCMETPSMWTFHGKNRSDFSLVNGDKRGEREGIWISRPRGRGKQTNKNRTIAKEIRTLDQTRFHRWCRVLSPQNELVVIVLSLIQNYCGQKQMASIGQHPNGKPSTCKEPHLLALSIEPSRFLRTYLSTALFVSAIEKNPASAFSCGSAASQHLKNHKSRLQIGLPFQTIFPPLPFFMGKTCILNISVQAHTNVWKDVLKRGKPPCFKFFLINIQNGFFNQTFLVNFLNGRK